MVMDWSGRLLPGFRATSLASFHLVMLPRNMSASTGPVTRSSPGLKPSRLTTGTVPPMMAGNWIMPSLSRSSPLTGASEAPKVTVLARICFRPPDEPIDW
ncbi:hypothetical protein FQZ97_1222350 [compost metagenome]